MYQKTKEIYGVDYFNQNNLKYKKRLILKAKELFGNKCQICTYDKCLSSLNFHHLESKEKLFSISEFYSVKSKNDKVPKSIKLFVAELNKCILICSNCHGEVHQNLIDISHIKTIIVTEEQLRIRNKKEKIILECDFCKNSFSRIKSKISKNNYCSQSCSRKDMSRIKKL